MTDVLIRDVPDDVVPAIESLRQFARTFADLGDPEAMRGAWE
jgi:hypothetical protein